jgi:hypothetical protein
MVALDLDLKGFRSRSRATIKSKNEGEQMESVWED